MICQTKELIPQEIIYQCNKCITEHGFKGEQHNITCVSPNKDLIWLMKALNGN